MMAKACLMIKRVAEFLPRRRDVGLAPLACIALLPSGALATGPALTGADVAVQVETALKQAGIAAAPIVSAERRFFPCDAALDIAPRVENRWDTVAVTCSAPIPWTIMLRTEGQIWGDDAAVAGGGESAGAIAAVVLRQAARKGQLITADMLELAPFDRAPAEGHFLDPAKVAGRRLTSNVAAGVPVRERHLQPDWAVKEGGRVSIEMDTGGITVASSGISLENGALGDIISVRNASSNKVLQGIVSDENKISVSANMN